MLRILALLSCFLSVRAVIYKNSKIVNSPKNFGTSSTTRTLFNNWFDDQGLFWNDTIMYKSGSYVGWDMQTFMSLNADKLNPSTDDPADSYAFLKLVEKFIQDQSNTYAVFKSDRRLVTFRYKSPEKADDSVVYRYTVAPSPAPTISSSYIWNPDYCYRDYTQTTGSGTKCQNVWAPFCKNRRCMGLNYAGMAGKAPSSAQRIYPSGQNGNTANPTKLSDCKALCDVTPECVGFTNAHSSSSCKFYSQLDERDLSTASPTTSYYRRDFDKDRAVKGDKSWTSVSCPGVGSWETVSGDDDAPRPCMGMCARCTGCVGFFFDLETGRCDFQKNQGGLEGDSGSEYLSDHDFYRRAVTDLRDLSEAALLETLSDDYDTWCNGPGDCNSVTLQSAVSDVYAVVRGEDLISYTGIQSETTGVWFTTSFGDLTCKQKEIKLVADAIGFIFKFILGKSVSELFRGHLIKKYFTNNEAELQVVRKWLRWAKEHQSEIKRFREMAKMVNDLNDIMLNLIKFVTTGMNRRDRLIMFLGIAGQIVIWLELPEVRLVAAAKAFTEFQDSVQWISNLVTWSQSCTTGSVQIQETAYTDVYGELISTDSNCPTRIFNSVSKSTCETKLKQCTKAKGATFASSNGKCRLLRSFEDSHYDPSISTLFKTYSRS